MCMYHLFNLAEDKSHAAQEHQHLNDVTTNRRALAFCYISFVKPRITRPDRSIIRIISS